MDRKLQLLGDQILRTLDQIPGNDSRSAAVREHVQALLDALEGPVVSDYASAEYNTPQGRAQAETVAPPGKAVRVPITTAKLRPLTNPPPKLTPTPPDPGRPALRSQRPGLFTERRVARQRAGVSLKSVAAMAHVTLPTARMYEAKRTAVKPEKRASLDQVYQQFLTS